MFKALLRAVNALIVIAILSAAVLTLKSAPQIPRLPEDLRVLASTPATEIYARNGELIGRLGGRQYVALDRISPHFIHAVLAAEDKRFYHHFGIDHLAVLRALWLNIRQGDDAPGGSSITQQLAKNLFFTFKRSWERKVLEALAAVAIEDRFSKEEILEAYCNLVYFGRFAYGVQRAARTYFNKSAHQLELHEAALLAGLPNAPARLDPFNYLPRARERQRTILVRMARAGYIQPQQIDSLMTCPLHITNVAPPPERGSYAVDATLDQAREHIGNDAVTYGGVRIFTTIDARLQRIAERVVATGVDLLELNLKVPPEGDTGRLEGGLVAVEVATGQILALDGGRNYLESPYNRAVISRRQPGSAFKPVIYLAALENLPISPTSVFVDEPVILTIDKNRTWSPRNYTKKYLGSMTLKYALEHSINTVAAQLIYKVGPMQVVETARRLGVNSALEPHLSLALGSTGITMVEMATIIATIARQGVFIDSRLLNRIEGIGGEPLAELFSVGEERFDAEIVYQLIDMLTGVIDEGTGTIIRRKGFSGVAFGKTGTSSDYRDSWFVGATPTLAVVVWVGYDDNRQMFRANGQGVTGSSGAAPIWADFIIEVTASEPAREFPCPRGIIRTYVQPFNGHISPTKVEGYIPVAIKP
ncbi:MAG: PBP1A family penicillin-binding protein [Calditrichaeota bacterium]|nr:PBP1A family penicillin-binding protein [Calditrichota bacterium]